MERIIIVAAVAQCAILLLILKAVKGPELITHRRKRIGLMLDKIVAFFKALRDKIVNLFKKMVRRG